MSVASLSRLDLDAHSLARTWGISITTVTTRPVSPCPRPHCQGSIMVWGIGPRSCLLCCRSEDDISEAGYEAEMEMASLMT